MKKLRLILILLLTVFLAYTAVDNHRLRSSLIRTIEIPADSPMLTKDIFDKYFYEDGKNLDAFRSFIPDSLVDPASTFETVRALVIYFGEFCANNNTQYHRLVPEFPDLTLKAMSSYKMRGSCYNDALFFSTVLQSIELKTRQIAFNSYDGLGGMGHSLIEYWDAQLGKWVIADPQQAAVLVNANSGKPMSAMEVRESILGRDKDEEITDIEIIQSPAGYSIHKDEVFDFYRTGIADYTIANRNDNVTAGQNSLAYRLSHWLGAKRLQGGNKAFESLGRLTRSVLDFRRVNYRVMDDFTPPTSYRTNYVLFHILFPLWILLVAWFIIDLAGRRIRRRR